MAIDSPYATFAEYQGRTNGQSAAEQLEVEDQLLTVSRVIEKWWGVRSFNSFTATLIFDGTGTSELSFYDDEQRMNFLQAVGADGIQVDEDIDGSFGTRFDPATETWVRLTPRNAAVSGEPYRGLELLGYPANSVLMRLPRGRGNVRIAGTWGWPAVPGVVTERVIGITRELRDLLSQGFTRAFENIDQVVQSSPRSASLLMLLQSPYNYRIPGFA